MMSGFDRSELVHVVYQVRMAEPFVLAHRVCVCLDSVTSGLTAAIVIVFVYIECSHLPMRRNEIRSLIDHTTGFVLQ